MEKSDWLRAVNQFTITKITCEVDMFKFPSPHLCSAPKLLQTHRKVPNIDCHATSLRNIFLLFKKQQTIKKKIIKKQRVLKYFDVTSSSP